MSNFNVGIQNLVQSYMNQAVGGYPSSQQAQFPGYPPQGFGQMQGGGAQMPSFAGRMMAPPNYIPNVGNTLQQYLQPGNNWGSYEPSPAPTPAPSSLLGGSSLLTTLLLLKALTKKKETKTNTDNNNNDTPTTPTTPDNGDPTWETMLNFIITKFDNLRAAGNDPFTVGAPLLPQDLTFGMEDVDAILKNREFYTSDPTVVPMAEDLKANPALFDLVDWLGPPGAPEGGIHDRTNLVQQYQAAKIMLNPTVRSGINEAVDYIKTNFDEISAELFINGGGVGNPTAMEAGDIRTRIEEMKTGTPDEQRIAQVLGQSYLGGGGDLVTILTHASGNTSDLGNPNSGFITREGIARFEEIFDSATSDPVTTP